MDICGGSGATRVHEPPAAAARQSQGGANSRALRDLYTPLQLSFSASGLRNMDTRFETNPLLVVCTNGPEEGLKEIGRSEVLLDTSEPIWVQRVSIDYRFETLQPLAFMIYDIATEYLNTPVKLLDWNQNPLLGEAKCKLSEILVETNHVLRLKLRDESGEAVGSILTVHAGETTSRIAFELTIRCLKLDNNKTKSNCDPFLRISRLTKGAIAVPLTETEVIKDNINPVWKPVILTPQQYGTKDTTLLVECFSFDANRKHSLIGALQSTVTGLTKLCNSKDGAVLYSRKGKIKFIERQKGKLLVDNAKEIEHHTFLDHISGFELKFMVALDFTASNGHLSSAGSLHSTASDLNSYQQAITVVGEVLQAYRNDSEIPAWGFGATIGGELKNCFNLIGVNDSSVPGGLEKLLVDYENTLQKIELAGPASFGPVINRVAQIARQSLETGSRHYTILLIVAHGVMTDDQEAKDAVVRASDLPISILIVGVGEGDFKEMRALDTGFGRRLESSTGVVVSRDMVQFARIKTDGEGNMLTVVQGLLEKLPGQVSDYIQRHPLPRRPRPVKIQVEGGRDLTH